MSDIDTSTWSESAASNNAAVPNGWPASSTMLPGQVDEVAREMMGALKRDWNRRGFTLTTGGSTTAFTLTPATAVSAYANGQVYGAIADRAAAASSTLNVSGLGAKKIYKYTIAGYTQTAANDWASDQLLQFAYNSALDGAAGGFVLLSPQPIEHDSEAIGIAVTSETGLVASGTGKFTFRMPYALTVSAVRASLKTAQSSGNILTIDINESGTTILSTKLTVDNGEKTSTTAATAAVISDSALADDAEITIDVDQIGDGTAAGLKVYIIGVKP